jgi:hypothetical protein
MLAPPLARLSAAYQPFTKQQPSELPDRNPNYAQQSGKHGGAPLASHGSRLDACRGRRRQRLCGQRSQGGHALAVALDQRGTLLLIRVLANVFLFCIVLRGVAGLMMRNATGTACHQRGMLSHIRPLANVFPFCVILRGIARWYKKNHELLVATCRCLRKLHSTLHQVVALGS